MSPTYKQLNITHQDFDDRQIEKLALLYCGGYDLQSKATLFLPQSALESGAGYQERSQCCAYVPLLSQAVDTFTSLLFVKELTFKPQADSNNPSTLGAALTDKNFYKLFASNCDSHGNSLHNFMRNVLTCALTIGFTYVGVDLPRDDNEVVPFNALEESSRGLDRGYLYTIDPCTVINWRMDASGEKFAWVVIKNDLRSQDSPLSPELKQLSFKIWTLDPNGFARWQVFQSPLVELGRAWNENDSIPLVDEGVTSFTEIPVLKMQVPSGLNVGNRIGPLCEEHYQRRSWQVCASNKACVIAPVFEIGDEYSDEGSMTVDPGRAINYREKLQSQGAIVLNKGESFSFQEPVGAGLALLGEQIKNVEQLISQVIQQMANSAQANHNSMARSAASKQQDRYSTEVILSAYARITKDFVKEILLCLSTGRKEAIVWSIDGLSTESKEEVDDLLKQVQMAPLVWDLLPSTSFRIQFAQKLSSAVLGPINPELEQQICDELSKGIKEKEQAHQDEQEIMKADTSPEGDDDEDTEEAS